MDIAELNANFGVPGVLAFDEPFPGMPRAVVSSTGCSAELYLHGAHLTHWQPAGNRPVLFLAGRSAFAPGKAIRGGVPVIFPWFGAVKDSPVEAPADAPSHGFARTSEWTLQFAAVAGDEVHLSLTLEPNQASRAAGWDHFRLAYEVVLGRALTLRFSVANVGSAPFLFEQALHTYLAVNDVRQVSLEGLRGTEFLDKTDGFRRKRQDQDILRFASETDRAYLNTAAEVTVADPVWQRQLRVGKANSATTVVWNPWTELAAQLGDLGADAWPGFVCVETANAAENARRLSPGEAWTMEARIHVAGDHQA